MSKLFLLTGSPKRITTSEPYRVIWNPQVMFGDQARYISQETNLTFSSKALATGVLTHYEPMPYEPEMLLEDIVPLDTNLMNFPILTASRPTFQITGMRVNRIADIAHADRRGKLPKVFQARLISSASFFEMDMFRYNLNASGTKYLALRILRDGNDLHARLVQCIDGVTTTQSSLVHMPDALSPMFQSESLRLIIFDDHLEFHLSDPGTMIITLPLPGPITVEAGAHLEIIREDFLEDGQDIPVIYGIDGLYIYDGYY